MPNVAQLDEWGFHGSYRPEDVTFLLRLSQLQAIDVAEKEYLIQSKAKHYSEMIGHEIAPSREHLQYFSYALDHGMQRLSDEVQALAQALRLRFSADQPIILVSLVRAGVPLGVLLKHQLSQTHRCFHYAISIIRDRGIDHASLNAIIHRHGAQSIVFVDGWTGKGAICQELTDSVKHHPDLFDQGWSIPRLVTLADLGGYAWLTASAEDWLIPFGMLGAVISGLTSRSILQAEPEIIHTERLQHERPEDWHQCILYPHLQPYDQSVLFVDKVLQYIQQNPAPQQLAQWSNTQRLQQQQHCKTALNWVAQTYAVDDLNRIKPGIAEATRAVLRRVPERILVQDLKHPDLQLILHFAQQHAVTVEISEQLGPYLAITLIKKLEKSI